MEYLRNLPFQGDFSIKELSDVLHSIQLEIIPRTNDRQQQQRTKNSYISQIYHIILTPSDQIKMPQSRWNSLCVHLLSFVVMMLPDFSLLPNLSLETRNPELLLFSIILSPKYLKEFNRKFIHPIDDTNPTQIGIPFPPNYYTDDQYLQAVISVVEQCFSKLLEYQTTMSSFYSRNLFYYTNLLPSLFYSLNKDLNNSPLCRNFFNQMIRKANTISISLPEQVTQDSDPEITKVILPFLAIEFIYNFFKFLQTPNESLVSFASSLLTDRAISPYLIHIIQAAEWTKSKSNRSLFFSLFYQSSRERVSDCFHQVKFLTLSVLFDRMTKVLFESQLSNNLHIISSDNKQYISQFIHFFIQALNGNSRNIQFSHSKSKASFEGFWSILYTLAKEKQFSWPLFTILDKVISTFNYLTIKMNVVKGFQLKNGIDEKFKKDRLISFYDQNRREFFHTKMTTNEIKDDLYTTNNYFNNIYKDLDSLLFSSYVCRYYDKIEDAIRGYESSIEIFDVNKFLQPLFEIWKSILLNFFFKEQALPMQIRSCILYYAEKSFKSFFNLMIFSSHALMLLNSMSKLNSSFYVNCKKVPHVTIRFIQFLKEIVSKQTEEAMAHSPMIHLIVSTLANCLYSATKKQVVTQNCVKLVLDLVSSNLMHSLLIEKMMEIAYNNLELLNEPHANPVNYFQQWFYLTLKIGDKKIAKILGNYQKPFVHQCLMTTNEILQPELLVLLIIYFKVMKKNLTKYQLDLFQNASNDDQSYKKIVFQRNRLEFQRRYPRESSLLLMDPTIFSQGDEVMDYSSAFSCFSYSGFDNSNLAAKLLHILQQKGIINLSLIEIITNIQFSKFLKYIRCLNSDSSFEMLDIIPRLGPLFIPYQNHYSSAKPGYQFVLYPHSDKSKGGIYVYSVFEHILANSSRTEMEAKHSLLLISYFIDNGISSFSFNDLKYLLQLLLSISRFDSLKPNVTSLFETLNFAFSQFKENDDFNYVYAFMTSISVNYSEWSKYCISLFKSYLFQIDITIAKASELIKSIFAKIQHAYPLINLLLLLKYLVQRKQGCLQTEDFFFFLNLLKEPRNRSNNPLLSVLLNKFIKTFSESIENTQKEPIFRFLYQLILDSSIFTEFKLVFLKRLKDFQMPKSTLTFSNILDSSSDIFYWTLSVILKCGNADSCISKEIVDKSVNELNIQQQNQLTPRFSFFNCLRKCTLLDISNFKQKGIIVSYIKFFTQIFRLFTSKQMPKAEKCLKWLRSFSPEYMPNQNFDPIPPENLITDDQLKRFWRYFFVPNDIKAGQLISILKFITFFSTNKFLDNEKHKIYSTLRGFLHVLSQIDFINNNELRNVVLFQPDEETYLSQFIQDIGLIFQLKSYPYQSFFEFDVLTFLSNFKIDSIYVILRNQTVSYNQVSYDLLYKLLLHDDGKATINSFIQIVSPTSELFSGLHPYTYDIECKLSQIEKFARYEPFRELIKAQFRHFFNRRQDICITDNDQNQLNTVVKCFINIEKVQPEFNDVIELSAFFASSSNVYTHLYQSFKSDIFHNRAPEFYLPMLTSILEQCFINETNVQLLPIDLLNMYPNNTTNEHLNNYKLYHNITNSATAIILSNLIRGIYENSFELGDLFETLLSMFSVMLDNREQKYTAVKCLYTLLKRYPHDKLNSLSEIMTKVQFQFKFFLEQPESYPIILTYKFASRLYACGMLIELPKFPIISNLLIYIFTFSKLLEYPFYPTILKFMRIINSYFNKETSVAPDDLLRSLEIFVVDKIHRLDIEKTYSILNALSSLVKKLPFSLLETFVHRLDICVKSKSQMNCYLGHISTIVKCIRYYNIPEEIQKLLSNPIFELIIEYLEDPTNTVISDQVFLIIKFVPEHYIDKIATKVNNQDPQVAKVARLAMISIIKTADESLLIKYRDIIQSSFEKLIEDTPTKLDTFFKIYINSIFTRPKFEECFGQHFIDFFNRKLDSKDRNMDNLHLIYQLLNSFIRSAKSNQKLDLLKKFMQFSNSHLDQTNYWLNTYLSFVGELPIGQQESFLDFIINRIKQIGETFQFLIDHLLDFLRSSKVSDRIKRKMLYIIPSYLSSLQYEEIQLLYEVIKQSPLSHFQLILACNLHIIMKSPDESRLLHIDNFSAMLGDNEIQRFLKLNEVFCPFLWSNEALLFTILSMSFSPGVLKPIAMVGDCFQPMSAQFAIALFVEIMNDRTVGVFHQLLRSILSLKQSYQYNQVISAIITTFHRLNYPMPLSGLYKSIKVTNDDYLYEMEMNLNTIDMVPNKLLLPNLANDILFSKLPEDASIEVLAASAQFFLSNYEEAAKVFSVTDISIYDKEPSSPDYVVESDSSLATLSVDNDDYSYKIADILEPMKRIADDFVQKKGSSHIFERYDHENDSIITNKLDLILNAINKSNENAQIKELLNDAWRLNFEYFKAHRKLSYFDLQRFLAITTTLMIINQRFCKTENSPKPISPVYPKFLLNASFNSFYSSFINNLQNHYYNNSDTPAKDSFTININAPLAIRSNDPQVIFSHEFRDIFQRIGDVNSHGFFSLPLSSIELSASNLISEMAKITAANSNKSMPQFPLDGSQRNNASDLFKKDLAEQAWPGFCFTLLAMNSSISPVLYHAALYGYVNIVTKSSLPYLMIHSSMARIITLFNIAASSENGRLIGIIKQVCHQYAQNEGFVQFLSCWKPQVENLLQHQWFSELFGPSLNHCKAFIKTNLSQESSIGVFHTLIEQLLSIGTVMFEYDEPKNTNSHITYDCLISYLDESLNESIAQTLKRLNKRMPLAFDHSMERNTLIIRQIHHNFIQISENAVAFTASTNKLPRQLFFVERSNSAKKGTTFSDIIFLFQLMLKAGYSTRLRSIQLYTPISMNIGDDMILYTLPCGINRLSHYEITSEPTKHIQNETDYFYMRKVFLNPSEFPPQVLFEHKRLILANFAAYSAIRSIFGLNRPEIDKLYLSFSSCHIPLFPLDFSIPTELTKTATLLPAELEPMLPLNYERQFILHFAAVHQTFVSFIDAFRSIVEIPIYDSLDFGHRSIDDILSRRDLIDASLLQYAPPFSEGANVSDSISWYQRLREFVEHSKDESFNKTVVDHPDLVSISSSLASNNSTYTDFSFNSNLPDIGSNHIAPIPTSEPISLFDTPKTSFGLDQNNSNLGVSSQQSDSIFGPTGYSFGEENPPYLSTNSTNSSLPQINSPQQSDSSGQKPSSPPNVGIDFFDLF